MTRYAAVPVSCAGDRSMLHRKKCIKQAEVTTAYHRLLHHVELTFAYGRRS
jgi:hypothetical protein